MLYRAARSPSHRLAAPLLAAALALGAARCAARSPGAAASSSPSPQATPRTPAERFDALARGYFSERARWQPVEATALGLHEHDAALPDYSPAGLAAYVRWLEQVEGSLRALEPLLPESATPAALDGTDRPRLDARLLRDAITLELRSLRDWNEPATRPALYHSLVADGVYQLLAREFAPVDARVRSAIARLRAAPALLAAGEARLAGPSRLSVEVSLRELEGSLEMVRDVFPRFAAGASTPALREAGLAASREATAALERHRVFLRDALLPRATGDLHDGAARWAERARYSDAVREPPAVLRDAGLAEVRRLQREMVEVAARVARPGEDLRATLARVKSSHPSAGELLPAYRTRQSALRAFVEARRLVSYDRARDELVLEETPAFLRATVFAALSSPGPFEAVARRTIFYVTPADTSRPASEVSDYLSEHSYAGLEVTSIHEAYPGHHVQGMLQREAPSLVRRVLWHGTYGEGWAHYTEQMMIDEGYGTDEVRLAQRADALLRAARAYLDPAVHAFGASYEDAVRFYRDEGYLSQPGAELEARRVCLNPATVFYYTHGKLGLYRLRRLLAARPETAPRARLEAFHSAVLRFGSAPLPLLARALYDVELPDWSPGEAPVASP